MQIVIDIPNQDYIGVCSMVKTDKRYSENTTIGTVYRSIANGKVLPEGHGDLIDKEVAKEEMREAMCGTGYQHIPLSVLNSEFLTPTIIEADKEAKE